tara:strand:+ start:2950 stop:3201 length:252 start_codon:yes stop_codon:yes gene_type:complete
MRFKKPKLDGRTGGVIGRTKRRLTKKDNPCKGKKGKAKLSCQYENKQLSQKAYIRKLRKLTGQKKERLNTRTYEFAPAKTKGE